MRFEDQKGSRRITFLRMGGDRGNWQTLESVNFLFQCKVYSIGSEGVSLDKKGSDHCVRTILQR